MKSIFPSCYPLKSIHILKISKEENFTTSLGNLYQPSVIFTEKVFPEVLRETGMFQFVYNASFPVTNEKTNYFALHLQVCTYISEPPVSLLFSSLNNPSSLSLFAQLKCSIPFTIFVALHCTFSIMSTCCLTSSE